MHKLQKTDMQLNPAQQKAVMHGTGPLLVLAGPGSGKTAVITSRIRYLIEREKIPPEQILVITFTKEAARSMEQRFCQQSTQYLPVNFGTFHSVFYHILQQSGTLQQMQLLKDYQKRHLLLPILNQYLTPEEQQTNHNSMMEDAIQVLSAISYYKNTGATEEAAGKLSGTWKEHFTSICSQYRQACADSGSIDFDDMVFLCHKLLKEQPKLRHYWQGRFTHILMDEFQDINPMQYRVIRLLAAKPYHLFAVGDDDQAIYGFRGSSPACLKQFQEDYQAEKVYLEKNYRSTPAIVTASKQVIAENRQRFLKELEAHRPSLREEKPVHLQAFPDRQEQYEYLLKCLREPSEDSRAVLFRTNAYLQSFAARLNREGIPFEMREKVQGIYEHFICKDIMTYLELAEGNRDRSLLLRVLNKPSRFIHREALPTEQFDFQQMRIFYQRRQTTMCGNAAQGRSGLQRQEAQRIGQVLQQIDRLEKHLKHLKHLPPNLAIRYICKAVGYEQYLRGIQGQRPERMEEWTEYLEWLMEDAGQHKTYTSWLQAQRTYQERMAEGKNGINFRKLQDRNAEKEPNADTSPPLQLMTVHASKGLEFDQVWIPDCNEKVFPHGRMLDTDACEEERRIFYVAMTRAKKSLELLYLTGTTERPRLPSRFLNPLF